ncbi:MAG: MerR family DNA-binding transcriptional regulator [Tessaracoccus sp.]
MLNIGEFAGLTGLSVKALRHYDDKGILVPAEVDGRSGYRRYGDEQVRDGAVIRALRDAGVPLPAVTTERHAALDALAAHRAAVVDQRAREDAAFADAEAALRAFAAPVAVERRHCPAQPFVGRIISVPVSDGEALTDDDANEALSGLFEQLQASGIAPSGQFWTTLRTNGNDRIEVVCCWPVTQAIPAEWGCEGIVRGELPERIELVAAWQATPMNSLPENATHPAVVALCDALAEQSINLSRSEVRQTVIGTDENNYTVEVAITVDER